MFAEYLCRRESSLPAIRILVYANVPALGHDFIPIYLHVFAKPYRYPPRPPLSVREEELSRHFLSRVRGSRPSTARFASLTFRYFFGT